MKSMLSMNLWKYERPSGGGGVSRRGKGEKGGGERENWCDTSVSQINNHVLVGNVHFTEVPGVGLECVCVFVSELCSLYNGVSVQRHRFMFFTLGRRRRRKKSRHEKSPSRSRYSNSSYRYVQLKKLTHRLWYVCVTLECIHQIPGEL